MWESDHVQFSEENFFLSKTQAFDEAHQRPGLGRKATWMIISVDTPQAIHYACHMDMFLQILLLF